RYLLQLTLLPVAEVREAIAAHRDAPEARGAQRLLAREVTRIVHGAEGVAVAEEATDVVFGREGGTPSAEALASLVDGIPTARVSRRRLDEWVRIVDLLVDAGVASSKSDARRTLSQQGVLLNDGRATPDDVVTAADLRHGQYLLVRRGKKN